jgi:transcriptional regulator with XRE-family HTH domain
MGGAMVMVTDHIQHARFVHSMVHDAPHGAQSTVMTPTETTARAIYAARYFRDMSRARLAAELERVTGRTWSAAMVTRTELASRPVDVATLQALAEILEVPLEFLLYGPTLVGSGRGPNAALVPSLADLGVLEDSAAA